MSEDRTLFEIGELVAGSYEIRSVLGEGGMGRVYGAHDVALNRRVAVKASWPSIETTLLAKEAQAIASVRHPGMIDVYGAGSHRGIPYLAMEFLYGINLETFLDKRASDSSPLAVTEVLDVLIPIADALAAVHRSGITHRDVKPANIMLTPNGRVVLMDFGLFTPESDNDSVLSGTPEYMAPESLTGKLDPRNAFFVDIYALGITAYELLTGDVPFPFDTPQKVVRAQVKDVPPPVRDARPDLAPRLAELVHEMLAKDPLERPPSMEAVAFRLRAAREAENTPAAAGERFTALVVDDDAALGKLLGLYVTRAVPDAQVVVVDDAERALTAIREKPPHVMLLDLHMPKMNGIELCMMLRGMHLADQCTIVAVSAGARDGDIDLLRQLGISRFIPKGAELGSLLGLQLKELHQSWLRTSRGVKRPTSSVPSLAPASASRVPPFPRSPSVPTIQTTGTTRMPPAREVDSRSRWLSGGEARSRMFEAVTDMVEEGVVVVDGDGEPQTWNPTAERLLGRPFARGGARTARPRALDEIVARALGGERMDDRTLGLDDGKGQQWSITLSARPVRDESDRIAGVVIVMRPTLPSR